jgi:hypothetical protein
MKRRRVGQDRGAPRKHIPGTQPDSAGPVLIRMDGEYPRVRFTYRPCCRIFHPDVVVHLCILVFLARMELWAKGLTKPIWKRRQRNNTDELDICWHADTAKSEKQVCGPALEVATVNAQLLAHLPRCTDGLAPPDHYLLQPWKTIPCPRAKRIDSRQVPRGQYLISYRRERNHPGFRCFAGLVNAAANNVSGYWATDSMDWEQGEVQQPVTGESGGKYRRCKTDACQAEIGQFSHLTR